MTRYLIDTNVLTAFVMGRPYALALVNPWVLSDEAATSYLVYGEVVEYLKRFPDFA